MKVTVRLFAMLRERAGTGEIPLEMPDDASVGDVWQRLRREHPRLHEYEGPVRFALDQRYVDIEEPLLDNAEVALIPPVSGG
jgi:molybdopterin converting factor subunit 1